MYKLKTASSETDVFGWLITLEYRLSSNAKINLGEIFTKVDAEVESQKSRQISELLKKDHLSQIVEWSMNQASLEDVFVRVASDAL